MTNTLGRDDFHYFSEMKKEPKEVFFGGNSELLKRPQVRIVGTRKPTQYPKQMTSDLAHRLANVGVAVVSGGAMGVEYYCSDALWSGYSLPNDPSRYV